METHHPVFDINLLYRLWGKTNERDKGYKPANWRSHPAVCHMIDVAFVAQVWLDANPFIMQRFCELAPGIDREQLRRIILTLTALHDLGKIHPYFQAKSSRGWDKGYHRTTSKPLETRYKGFDHGLATARIMQRLRAEFPQWQAWGPAVRASAAHHGSFHDLGKITGSASECPPLTADQRLLAVAAVRLLCDLFNAPEQLPPLPQSKGFLMFLTGFISVSDWFGSNSTLFPFTSADNEQRVREYFAGLDRTAVVQALRNAGLLPTYKIRRQDFADLFDFLQSDADLRPLQARARDINFGNRAGAEMVVVEAPMGMGKTEIALYLAAGATASGTVDGLYFALPTQASSNSMMDRIRNFSDRVKEDGSTISFMLAHSGRTYDKTFAELIVRAGERGNKEQNKENTPSEVIAPDWLLSSKRVLLSAVGVGTIDQAMLGAVSVRHAFVRLFALAGKVVVFDEIHAYDAYMNRIILRLLEWLRLLETKVILLSATLPGSLRRDLLTVYCSSLPSEQAGREPYPQLLHVQNGVLLPPFTLSDTSPTPGEYAKPAVSVTPLSIPNAERTSRGADKAMELVRKGGNVAWIRNTVKEAQEAYRALAERCAGEDIELELLHAQYIRADRNQKERALLRRLGKEAGNERPTQSILIATQVIEQSVDIDFDAMISDIAPVDLLLQRIGRLWRHERTGQRHGHTTPELYALTPSAEECRTLAFGPSAYVYDADTLLRTAVLLRDERHHSWNMPDACRDLVAEVYDRDGSWWSAERLGADQSTLDKVRRDRIRCVETMQREAKAITLRGATEQEGEPAMALVVLTDNDKGERIALTTRYGMYSATVVLLRIQDERPVFAGAPALALAAVPDGDDVQHRLDIDEAIALSSVSFPWYGDNRLIQPSLPEKARAVVEWWQERHPYDNRLFLVLDTNGGIQHERFTARYDYRVDGSAAEGLVIEERFAPGEQRYVQATMIV